MRLLDAGKQVKQISHRVVQYADGFFANLRRQCVAGPVHKRMVLNGFPNIRTGGSG